VKIKNASINGKKIKGPSMNKIRNGKAIEPPIEPNVIIIHKIVNPDGLFKVSLFIINFSLLRTKIYLIKLYRKTLKNPILI
jgi:hypothetical protein